MLKGKIDLHLHTTASDGTWEPEELIDRAIKLGFSCISITDHDSIHSIKKAIEYSKDKPIEVISGVELSVEYKKQDIHLLAYGIDIENEEFQAVMDFFHKKRKERAKEIIRKLNAIGMGISYEDLADSNSDPALGRLHIANALIESGHVTNLSKAFKKYLLPGKPAYVEKEILTPEKAIEITHKAGGINVLAHPGIYKRYRKNITEFKEFGIEGIEVFHTNHLPDMTKKLLDIAEKESLLVTGGSDCHGINKEHTLIGKIELPHKYFIEFYKKLREAESEYEKRNKK